MDYKCLIVDDEKELAESTCEYFNLFDLNTHYVLSYQACLDFFRENTAGLILLDINLADQSGFDLCKELRRTIDVPILFISARSSDDDILLALNIGGDDYIQKPYTLSVLLAKVKVVLKRLEHIKEVKWKEEDRNKSVLIQTQDIYIDEKAGKVYRRGEEVPLKGMEFKLLHYLVQNKGRIIPKEELFDHVWEDVFTGDSTLNVHIRHLREKLENHPNEPIHIKTVWGRGYSYED